MIRGVERRNIFRDDADRKDLLAQAATLLPETQTACYAWVLMPNPVDSSRPPSPEACWPPCGHCPRSPNPALSV
jgi:hypothetical protein